MDTNTAPGKYQNNNRDVIVFAWIFPVALVFVLYLVAWRIDILTSKDSFAGFGYFVFIAPFMTVIGISNFWVLGLRGKNKKRWSLFLRGLILPLTFFMLFHII